MGAALVLIGVGCIIAAIVGGGVKLQQLEVGQVTSLWRQGLLGAFGILLSSLGAGINLGYFSVPAEGVASANTAPSVNAPQRNIADAAIDAASNVANTDEKMANAGAPPAESPIVTPPIVAKTAPAPPPPPKPAAEDSLTPTLLDRNGQPVVDISGLWVDEGGHRLHFVQAKEMVTINGNQSPGSAETWTGNGNVYRETRFQLSFMQGPGKGEFCRGQTYKTTIKLQCEGPPYNGNWRYTTLRKIG